MYLSFAAQSSVGCFIEGPSVLGPMFFVLHMCPVLAMGLLPSVTYNIGFTATFIASIASCIIAPITVSTSAISHL